MPAYKSGQGPDANKSVSLPRLGVQSRWSQGPGLEMSLIPATEGMETSNLATDSEGHANMSGGLGLPRAASSGVAPSNFTTTPVLPVSSLLASALSIGSCPTVTKHGDARSNGVVPPQRSKPSREGRPSITIDLLPLFLFVSVPLAGRLQGSTCES